MEANTLGAAIPNLDTDSNSHYLNRASSHWPVASLSLVSLPFHYTISIFMY